MDILVLGGGGQLGAELRRHRWPSEVRVHAPERAALDITDEAAVNAAFAERPYAAAINAAAYTAVDKAETDVAAAWRLNALAPALLAAAAQRHGTPLIHVSTDYVFDGTLDRAYVETDPVAPLGVYGASKLGGEQAVRTAAPRHAILRTSWVVSAHRANFVKTMLRLAGERNRLRVVDDQFGRPTAAKDLAAAAAAVALRFARDLAAPSGIYNVANAGETTWCGFAREIMRQSRLRGGPHAEVDAIATPDFPTPARRPANSRLDTRKFEQTFGLPLADWREALSDILDELLRPAQPREVI